MSKPKNETDAKKGDPTPPNMTYLKKWDKYSSERGDKRQTLLLPIILGIGRKGQIVRRRMLQPEVKELWNDFKGEIPPYIYSEGHLFPNPTQVFEDYLEYFKGEGTEGPPKPKPTPLDWVVDRPVFLLYTFFHKDTWSFTEKQQFSTLNDPDNATRNLVKICTFNDRKALLLWNRCRSNPKDLKFNLHVSINQSEGEGTEHIDLQTDIIIDPGGGNLGTWPN